VSERSKLMK